MTDRTRAMARRYPDIGFTFVEEGTKTLPNGQVVPRFKGTPNDLEAHKRVIRLVEEEVGKSP